MDSRLYREALEGLREHKRARNFYRLEATISVEHEYRGAQHGHPSTYAFTRFECAPADDLSFETQASWPPTMDKQERVGLERAIAEGVADVLLSGIYQHSGCSVALVEVRWDDICSSEAAFMKAAGSAMQNLLGAQWKLIIKKQQ